MTTQSERRHWLFTWACGCGFSVMTEDAATTESEAWRETFETRAEEHAYRDAGVTCTRITHTEWETEHRPKFLEPCGCGSPRPAKRRPEKGREPDLLAEVTELERDDHIDVPDLPQDIRQAAETKYLRTFNYYNGHANVDAHAVALTEAFKTVWEAGYRAGWDAGDDGLSDLAIDNAVETKLEEVWGKAHESVGDLAVTLAPVLRAEHPFDVREDTSRIVEEVLRAADR